MKLQSHPHIYNGSESLNEVKRFADSSNYSALVVIVDEKTEKFCLPHLNRIIENYLLLRIKSGEENKSLSTCVELWKQLSDADIDRKALIINLGGGVVCDTGGFVASTFKRGVDFIHIPTTLLAMCDASIGGKTGVNLDELKNQIGAIVNPKAIFVWPAFLDTLPEKHFLSGFAEIIKHTLICDKDFFYKLKDITDYKKNIAEFIAHSINIKTGITESDINEDGVRKSLNFGHSIGHALESFFMMKEDEKQISHGEAVAAGMIMELKIAMNKKFISSSELDEIISVILRWFPKVVFEEKDFDSITAYVYKDKKNERKKLLFTLLDGIGKFRIDEEVYEDDILDALGFYCRL